MTSHFLSTLCRRGGIAFLLGFLASASLARAQEAQLTLQPPLSQAFPLQAGPTGVHVTCPVLVNDHTILRPDVRLRFIYIDTNPTPHPRDDGGSFKSLEGPHGTITPDHNTGGSTHGEDGPVSAWGGNNTDDTSGLFDPKKESQKANKEELQKEVWNDRSLFADAFDHAAETGTTLVYDAAGKGRATSTLIDPPEGLLLAEVGGHIRVLAVEPESRPYAAGIRAGDEIRSFEDGIPITTLDQFLASYGVVKHEAHVSGNLGYTLNVWSATAGDVVPVRIAPPPSIPSFL